PSLWHSPDHTFPFCPSLPVLHTRSSTNSPWPCLSLASIHCSFSYSFLYPQLYSNSSIFFFRPFSRSLPPLPTVSSLLLTSDTQSISLHFHHRIPKLIPPLIH